MRRALCWCAGDGEHWAEQGDYKSLIVYFLVICLFLESWGTGVFGLLLLSCCRREHFGTLLDTREVFEEIELRVAVFGDRIAEESLQLRLKAFLSVARKLF